MSMSRLLSLEAEDFMGYEYFRVDFDDTNIISLKGYNSAGKTTLIRSFGVLNFGLWSMKQSKFIRYGRNMFRIRENFSDGVTITFEKWASGKSSYTMTKDGEEIFSTIENGVYMPFKGVPEFIQRYLNLIDDSAINLHLRRGRDGLLLVDTTGRENYLFLSSALKAEELSNASAMLKTDRLDVKSSVSAIEYEIEGYRNLVSKDKVVTSTLVDYLEEHDKVLELNESKKERLDRILELVQEYSKIKPSVHLETIETSKVKKLGSLFKTIQDYKDVKVTLNLNPVDGKRLQMLNGILSSMGEFNKRKTMPSLNSVDLSRFNKVIEMGRTLETLAGIESKITANNIEIADYKNKVAQIEKWLKDNGIQAFKCKSCGELQAVGEVHQHA